MSNKLTIIAGPCSIDHENLSEIYEIANIEVVNQQGKKQKAIFGTRVVGLKSRTNLNINPDNFIGIDLEYYLGQKSPSGLPPSVQLAEQIIKNTNLLVASEVMMPSQQLPHYNNFPQDKLLFWNPAVNQLGWNIYETALYCKQRQWYVGIKNGKWFDQLTNAESQSSMEKTWIGLSTFSQGVETILIHRGVDCINKGNYRNYPVHKAAERTKKAVKVKMFFDPSHVYGPKLRDKIVEFTIAAMKLKTTDNSFLYDGILIEVGHSKSDANQHITVKELEVLVQELSTFRTLATPEEKIYG